MKITMTERVTSSIKWFFKFVDESATNPKVICVKLAYEGREKTPSGVFIITVCNKKIMYTTVNDGRYKNSVYQFTRDTFIHFGDDGMESYLIELDTLLKEKEELEKKGIRVVDYFNEFIRRDKKIKE